MTLVKRTPVDTGITGWDAILPKRTYRQPLNGNSECDVAIIGGGFTGLAAARRLHQLSPELKIALLDAGAIGEGPVGRNTGFMIDLPHHLSSGSYVSEEAERDIVQTKLNRMAINFAKQASADYRMPDGVAVHSGKVNAAANARGMAHNEEYVKQLEQLGEPFTLLDAAGMKKLTGSDYYLGGLFTPGTLMLQPAAYARYFAAGIADSITIYEHSPVVELSSKNSLWHVKTSRGMLATKKVILATNGHIESFGFFKRRLVHIHLFGSMSRCLTSKESDQLGGDRNWALTPSDPAGSTVRRFSDQAGDRIVVRNSIQYTPKLESSESILNSFGRAHDQSFKKRFPNLPEVTMEYRWGGRLCLSLNDTPAFGEIEKNLYAACCQNGLGAAQGTLSGIAIAELALEQSTEANQFLCACPTPKKLPPYPLDDIGAKISIAWQEIRAGREK